MISAAPRLLFGACLIAGRSIAFHVPVASSLSRHSRTILGTEAKCNSALRRRIHSSGIVMQAGAMQETIEGRLKESLSPVHLEVINESHMHSGPAKESHFKVIVVTDEFEGKSLVARHRMVNALFAEEMTGKQPVMHALSIQGKTPSQWEAEGHKVVPSPPCMGGSKADPSMRNVPPALGATRRGPNSRGHGARLFSRQRSAGFGTAAAAAGLIACAVWLCYPGSAAAAAAAVGQGARAEPRAAAYAAWAASVDKAFYRFAESLATILDERQVASNPVAQCLVMFNTAWVTTSTAPIAAAGVIGQPLGRAMVATASSHASFAAAKFSLAVLAMSKLPTLPSAPSRSSAQRRYGRPSERSKPKPTARNPPVGRPQGSLPVKRTSAPSGPTAAGAGSDSPTRVTIQVRRSAKSIPRLWLMVVTALGGPAVGAVLSAVMHRLGYIAMPAALSTVTRGSVLGTLVAGSLCYGGSGTWLATRWAVFQGVFGALFAGLLSPSVLMFVFLCNYYARAAGVGRGGPGRGGRGGAPRGGERHGRRGPEDKGRDRGNGRGSEEKNK